MGCLIAPSTILGEWGQIKVEAVFMVFLIGKSVKICNAVEWKCTSTWKPNVSDYAGKEEHEITVEFSFSFEFSFCS